MNFFKTTLLATALIAVGAISPANAADNKKFDVTLTIEQSCDVMSAADIGFGIKAANAGTVNAQGNVVVQCTVDTAYALALDRGAIGANINARQMELDGGTATIAYQLYQDTGTSTVWGDGTVGTAAVGDGAGYGTGAPFDQVHTVYAEATIAGTEPVGDYSDTVTATVTF